MANDWIFYRSVIEGEELLIDNLNIWENSWHDQGERIQVKDPLYHQDHTMNVYEIREKEKVISFAAGEFSNMVWGIYLPSK